MNTLAAWLFTRSPSHPPAARYHVYSRVIRLLFGLVYLANMAMNVSEVGELICLIEEPTEKTWLDWAWKVKDAMGYSNVWCDIMERDANGDFPSPPAPANPNAPTALETAALRDWNHKSRQAIRWLSEAAGWRNADICNKYEQTYDAKGLWNELEARFFPKDLNMQLIVLKEFVSIPKLQEDSWDDYFKKQDDSGKRFSEIFPAVTPLHDIENLCFMMNTMNHLPPSHPIRTNALSAHEPSSESLRNAIRAHIVTNGEEPPTETAAFTGAGASGGKAKCYFCQYSSHTIQTCKFVNYYYTLFLQDKKNHTGPFANRGSKHEGWTPGLCRQRRSSGKTKKPRERGA